MIHEVIYMGSECICVWFYLHLIHATTSVRSRLDLNDIHINAIKYTLGLLTNGAMCNTCAAIERLSFMVCGISA